MVLSRRFPLLTERRHESKRSLLCRYLQVFSVFGARREAPFRILVPMLKSFLRGNGICSHFFPMHELFSWGGDYFAARAPFRSSLPIAHPQTTGAGVVESVVCFNAQGQMPPLRVVFNVFRNYRCHLLAVHVFRA